MNEQRYKARDRLLFFGMAACSSCHFKKTKIAKRALVTRSEQQFLNI